MASLGGGNTMAETRPDNPDQLNGWKEIAAYVGRSVRAAQRWERELQLPVHRIKTPRGHVIYALKREMDQWRLRAEGALLEEESDQTTLNAPTARIRRHLSPGAVARALLGAGAAAAVLFAVFRALPTLGSKAEPGALQFGFDGGRLEALDRNGRQVWSLTFGSPDESVDSPSEFQFTMPKRQRLARLDLDDDGHEDVVAAVRYPTGGSDVLTSWKLVAVSSTRRVLWEYIPNVVLTFGGLRFEAPWLFSRMAVRRTGEGPQVWLGVIHHLWWPSFAVRIDPRGTATTRFVNSGHIYNLAIWPLAEAPDEQGKTRRSLLAAAGINNEYGVAALALLDPDGPPAVSPQTPESPYFLREAPSGRPVRYVLFPRSELSLTGTFPYNRVVQLNVLGRSLQVLVAELPEVQAIEAYLVYEITPDLRVVSAAWSDGLLPGHRYLERQGRVGHPIERCPDRTAPRRVRIWDPETGWAEQMVPMTAQAPPGILHQDRSR